MAYRIEIRPAAARTLSRLPTQIVRQLDARIRALSDNPRPHGSQKLAGADDHYRIRSGDYRIIYQIQDRIVLVVVVRIGHRREIYRHL